MTAISWKSPVSGSWTTATDWSTGTVPAAGDDVTIGVGGSYVVSIVALPVTVKSLTVNNPSAVLTIDTSGAGGSNVAVTGTLTNSAHIEIGNANLSTATTVSVNGLSNTGEIDLTGSATVQATLDIVGAAPATLTGQINLAGDALLEYGSGTITAIGSGAQLYLNGSNARISLTTLTSNAGTLRLDGGAVASTTTDLSNSGLVEVDVLAGGSRLTIGGVLNNSGHIEIGNASLASATTVSVNGLSNTGEVDLTGSATVQAALLVEPGAPVTLTGQYLLSGDAELGFESGGVTAIGNSAKLSLTGPKARVALGAAPRSSSALSQLGSSLGTLQLENGASVATAVAFLNNGVVDVDDVSGSGASRLTFGGTVTNRGNMVIGNALLAAPTIVSMVNLVNAATIDLTGSGAIQTTLNVTAAAPSTFTGINKLIGDALLEYASGAVNNIVIGSSLSLNGPKARVALASALNSNSALTKLAGNAGTFDLENGAVVVISGGFTNTGATDVDTGGGAGGSQLTISGALTNSAIINPNGVKIGNTTLSAATIVTASGLVNTGETDITGALSVQATLNITGAATPTLTGRFILTNDALLEYGSGAITGIDNGAELFLDGASTRVALAAATSSNSALTTLSSNLGTLRLDGGGIVTTTTDFSNSGLVQVDDITGVGGSQLTIGGALTNNFVSPGNAHITIGNTALGAATIVTATALSNSGEIDLTGSPLVQATLNIAGAAPTTLTGTNNLTNDALLEYGSGAITTIGSGAVLFLNGSAARVALVSTSNSNSMLTKLASNVGTLRIDGGAHISTTTAFSNSGLGLVEVDDIGRSGGSQLTIGGTLTNVGGTSTDKGRISIGNGALSAPTTVTAAAVSNSGEIDLTAGQLAQAKLQIATTFSNGGLVTVDNVGNSGGSLLTIGGALTNTNRITIGNTALSAPTSVAVASVSNPGEIDLTGAPSVQATLTSAGAAPATLIGRNILTNDALLQYKSGAITAIGSGAILDLTGAGARVALAATPASNSALTTLANNNGTLGIDAGAQLVTTVALTNSASLFVDNAGAGGSSLTIGGMLDNSGTVDIGNGSSLTQATSVSASALDNLAAGKIVIAGRAAPATLTLAGTSTDAGSIAINSLGILALGGTLTVAGSLNLSGGEISGGTLTGSGTIGSSASSSSTLTNLTIAAGTTFTAGANSMLTINDVTIAGALKGGGSAGLVFRSPGADTMTNISGFPTITLADGGANTLTL
ncbi:MAG TPA: hypothetical protein VGR45_00270, partial [Stellaceae bacterium]|nr:hypothetical protein [Stellaceae bacterium]